MQKTMKKTPEAAAAEQEQVSKLRDEIKALCNRVPPQVLGGSYQTAVACKKAASEAYRLATSIAPTPQKLNDAKTAMQIAAST